MTLLADPWYEEPYSQYSDAVVATDHDVHRGMGGLLGTGQAAGPGYQSIGTELQSMDAQRPSKFEVLSAITAGSRVPAGVAARQPGRTQFPEHKVAVVEAATRMQAPANCSSSPRESPKTLPPLAPAAPDARFDLRLICSRSKYVLNSSGLNLSLH